MNKTLKGLTSFVSAALVSLCIGCGHPTNKVAISPRGKIAYSVNESSNYFIPSEDSSRLVVSNRFGEIEEIIEGGYWPDFNKKGELLYLKGDEDNNNLFVEEENLTNTENITYGTPSWKPDGSRIVFVSNRDNKSQEQLSDLEKLEIYEISLENKEFRRITDNNEPEAFPVYSPDGGYIASLRGIKNKLPEILSRILDSEEGIELLVMDENGNNQKIVENPSLSFVGDLGGVNYNFLDRLFSWHRDYIVYTSFEKVVKSLEKRFEGMSESEIDKLSELEKAKVALDCFSSIEIARYNPKTGKAEFLTRNKVPDLGAIVFGDTLAYISVDERGYEKAKKEFKLMLKEEKANEGALILGSQIATYIMDINGQNVKRISKQDEVSIPIAWMPDGKLVMMAVDKNYLKELSDLENTEPSDVRIILQDLGTGERVDITTPINLQLRYADALKGIQESIQERIEKLEKSAQEFEKLKEKPKEDE